MNTIADTFECWRKISSRKNIYCPRETFYVCPNCSYASEQEFKFCPNCNTQLRSFGEEVTN